MTERFRSNEMASFEETMAGNDLPCCVTPRVTDGTKDASNTIPQWNRNAGGKNPPAWMAFESETSKRERGHGWGTFRRKVREERGNKCERCGAVALSDEERSKLPRIDRQRAELHLHHKLKQDFHRHLKFERSNVVVCCQACHAILEKEADLDPRNINPVLERVAPTNASEQRIQQAGAKRPNAKTDPKTPSSKTASINRVNTIENVGNDSFPAEMPSDRVYPPRSAVNINLKLRNQAKKLGLIPGSPRWRAYVLGTASAMKKRKRRNDIPNLTDGVTPVKCTRLVTNLSDNRTEGGVG